MAIYFSLLFDLDFLSVVFLSLAGAGSAGFSILAAVGADGVIGFMPLRILVTSGAFLAKQMEISSTVFGSRSI
jgi:hypothetical protein